MNKTNNALPADRIPGAGYTTSHPDFHLPDAVKVGGGFDVEKYLAALKRGQVDVVYFFAKCHYGNSYYYTKVGRRHPGLRTDLMRSISKACRQAGIKFIVYFSGGIDTYAGKQHPDWRAQVKLNEPPAPVASDANLYLNVCLFGPYTDEWLIPQMREAAREYEMDGMMTDTMSSFICCCPHCRAGFTRDTGLDFPADEGAPAWREFARWRYGQKDVFARKICRAVQAERPGLPVGLNWMYSIRDPVLPPPEIGYLLADDCRGAAETSMTARYFAGTGRPFEIMTGRFLHGLGDWSIKPLDMLKQNMAVTAANGGRCTLIDRQLPDGNLDGAYYRRLGEVFGFVHARAAAFRDAAPAAQTAILHSASSMFGAEKQFYGRHAEQMKSVEGAALTLTETSRHTTLLGEAALAERIADYESVILPESRAIPPDLEERLREYVRNGGVLLATHPCACGADVPPLADVFGVSAAGEYASENGYLSFASSEEHEFAGLPLLVRGRGLRLQCRSARPLGEFYEPMSQGLFGWGVPPPAAAASAPGIVLNEFGKGRAVLIAAPLFAALRNNYNPMGAWLIDRLLRLAIPRPLLDVQAEPGLEVSLMRQTGGYVVHLINKGGERQLGGPWRVIPNIRPSGPVRFRLRLPSQPKTVDLIPSGNVEHCWADGCLECAVDSVPIHLAVRVTL